MVQIYIQTADDGKTDEWSIIELQGDLAVTNNEGLTHKFLADLHYNKDGTPFLIIGHHLMVGKVINLEKPMVMLQKVRREIGTKVKVVINDEDEGDKDEEMVLEENDATKKETDHKDDDVKIKTEYIVKAVIRKKILFNKRPRPIVFNS